MNGGEKIDAQTALELIATERCRLHSSGEPPHYCQRSFPEIAEWCPSCLANAALSGVKLPKLSPLTLRDVTDEQYAEDLDEYLRRAVAADETETV